MNNTFSSKEIDTLVDALDAWERKDATGQLMGGLFKAILSDKMDDEGRAKMEAKEREEEEKYNREARQRKEISLLLKAKLITLKHEQEISEMTERQSK